MTALTPLREEYLADSKWSLDAVAAKLRVLTAFTNASRTIISLL